MTKPQSRANPLCGHAAFLMNLTLSREFGIRVKRVSVNHIVREPIGLLESETFPSFQTSVPSRVKKVLKKAHVTAQGAATVTESVLLSLIKSH